MTSLNLFRPAFMVSLIIVLIAISVLWTAYDYSGASGTFPRHMGWVFLALALVELFSQFKISRKIHTHPELDVDTEKQTRDIASEILAVAWLGILLISLYLFGFMMTVPVYLFAFLRLTGRLCTAKAAMITAGVSLMIYLLFFQLLNYQLFPGILFNGN